MPKQSKVTMPSSRNASRPGSPTPQRETLDKFRCTRCGKIYKNLRGNFSPSHSPLYLRNDGYLPVCCTCLDDLYDHYKEVLGSDSEAMKRICMKFDIYWTPEAFAMIKVGSTNSRVKSYLSKVNLVKFVEKTYDDTLDEERMAFAYTPNISNTGSPEETDGEEPEVTPDVIAFWGPGFDDNYYRFVQSRYNVWTKGLPDDLPVSTEALYKQICDTEATIARDTIIGKETDKSKATLMNLLGALNEKPVQKKADSDALDQTLENMPFGMGIRMCENMRPIPKPDPELEDVDGIVRYVTVWFLGHLCKMLGIKNTYCRLYEEEMARLRVERQIDEDEDDEDAFNDIFADHFSDSGDDDDGGDPP